MNGRLRREEPSRDFPGFGEVIYDVGIVLAVLLGVATIFGIALSG